MTLVRRSSPFGELLSLRQAMDRLFEDSFVRPDSFGSSLAGTSTIPLDLSTGADAVTVEAALPGIGPDDVDITVENGTLTIRARSAAERSEPNGEYIVREIRRGEFSRSLGLPPGLEPDKASATFQDGILTLRIPKAEQVKPRQIRITPTGNGQISSTSADAPAAAGDRG